MTLAQLYYLSQEEMKANDPDSEKKRGSSGDLIAFASKARARKR